MINSVPMAHILVPQASQSPMKNDKPQVRFTKSSYVPNEQMTITIPNTPNQQLSFNKSKSKPKVTFNNKSNNNSTSLY